MNKLDDATKANIIGWTLRAHEACDTYSVGADGWWRGITLFLGLCKGFKLLCQDHENELLDLSTIRIDKSGIYVNLANIPEHTKSYPLSAFRHFHSFSCQSPTSSSSPPSPPTVHAQNAADQTQPDSSQTDNESTLEELQARVISLSERVSALEDAIIQLLTVPVCASTVDLTSFSERIMQLKRSASEQTKP